jgi:crotonobetainyl-CoA:carnitine CoA-transferase CaiB-like acyl-CoA transferase
VPITDPCLVGGDCWSMTLPSAQVGSEAGPVSIVAPAARFNRQERTLGPVPALGEHTHAIKAEFASSSR